MGIPEDWRDAIAAWASDTEEVARVTAYGSRITGVRRPKDNQPPTSDLDLAVQTVDTDCGNALGNFMGLAPRWAAHLSSMLGVEVDLRHHDPSDPEDDVTPFLAKGCEQLWP